MEADTYSNDKVVKFSNSTFVNVELSVDNQPAEAEQFGVTGIPVTYLVTPDGAKIGTWLGYVGPEDYMKNLAKAVKAHGALKTIEPKLAGAPDDPKVNEQAGDAYADLGNAEKAAAAYRKAAAGAQDAKAKGALLVKTIDQTFYVEGAEADLKRMADELDALDADGSLGFKDNAVVTRAILATQSQDFDAGIAGFEKALKTWPKGDKNDLALFWLGYLYHEVQKDHKKGIATLERLIREYPKSENAADAKGFIEHIKEHAGLK